MISKNKVNDVFVIKDLEKTEDVIEPIVEEILDDRPEEKQVVHQISLLEIDDRLKEIDDILN